MKLEILKIKLCICKLKFDDPIPDWSIKGDFFSVTRTSDELSLVCSQSAVPANIQAENDWRVLKVQGPLDFGLTGILSKLSTTLAEAGISIFAISTFDTDYLLVREEKLAQAIESLKKKGYEIIDHCSYFNFI